MALLRTIAAAVLFSTLSASQQASAQGDKDNLYIGCTQVANTLTGAPEGSLTGSVGASLENAPPGANIA